jgi:hypothetical protein
MKSFEIVSKTKYYKELKSKEINWSGRVARTKDMKNWNKMLIVNVEGNKEA